MLLMQMQVSGVFLRAESNSSTPDTWHTVCSHYIHYTHPSWDLTRPGLTWALKLMSQSAWVQMLKIRLNCGRDSCLQASDPIQLILDSWKCELVAAQSLLTQCCSIIVKTSNANGKQCVRRKGDQPTNSKWKYFPQKFYRHRFVACGLETRNLSVEYYRPTGTLVWDLCPWLMGHFEPTGRNQSSDLISETGLKTSFSTIISAAFCAT